MKQKKNEKRKLFKMKQWQTNKITWGKIASEEKGNKINKTKKKRENANKRQHIERTKNKKDF